MAWKAQEQTALPDAPLEQVPVLEVSRLEFSYDGIRTIFSEVSFSLGSGEVLALMGANGAGKTSLIDCLSGFRKPNSGKVRLLGRELESISHRECARIIAYVPQAGVPMFSYQVRDYVALGCAASLGLLSTPGQREMALVEEVLDRLSISHLEDKLCTQISGGEFQQVQIARALVQQPRLILLDEPTNHLDYGNQIKILNVIRELSQNGIAVILTTHNPDHVMLLNGKVGVLDKGGTFECGDVDDILSEERLGKIYGVPVYVEYVENAQRMACVSGALDPAGK